MQITSCWDSKLSTVLGGFSFGRWNSPLRLTFVVLLQCCLYHHFKEIKKPFLLFKQLQWGSVWNDFTTKKAHNLSIKQLGLFFLWFVFLLKYKGRDASLRTVKWGKERKWRGGTLIKAILENALFQKNYNTSFKNNRRKLEIKSLTKQRKANLIN